MPSITVLIKVSEAENVRKLANQLHLPLILTRMAEMRSSRLLNFIPDFGCVNQGVASGTLKKIEAIFLFYYIFPPLAETQLSLLSEKEPQKPLKQASFYA